MQATLDIPTINPPTVSQADVHHEARAYVATAIDPYFADAPIEMSLVEFQMGWEEKDRQYGVIGLAPP